MISLEITIASLRLVFRKLNENKVIFNAFFSRPSPLKKKVSNYDQILIDLLYTEASFSKSERNHRQHRHQ